MNGAAYFFGALAVLVTALGTAYGIWRKAPSEGRDITITSADRLNQMTLRFSEAVDDDNVSLRQQLHELREQIAAKGREEAQYRADVETRLAELSAQVRAEKAEKESVKAENLRLTKRVADLEDEVRNLRDAPPRKR